MTTKAVQPPLIYPYNNEHELDNEPVKDDGDTPLICAARNGHTAAVKTLLVAGAKVDLCNFLSEDTCADTPLIVAADEGHDGVVKALLRYGRTKPDLALANDDGFTPLHLAVMHCHAKVVRVLLDAGAKPTPKMMKDPKTVRILQLFREVRKFTHKGKIGNNPYGNNQYGIRKRDRTN